MVTDGTSTIADLIASRLHAAGCRHAFGLPGGEILDLVRALEAAGIHFMLAKHETAAGFMAEAAHHATGAPGVLVATLGPGAMNAVNAVANAWQERIPMVVLTGCVDAEDEAQYTHQVLDHRKVFEPIAKATFRISPGSADLTIEKALGIATSGRPGPVHLDLPIGAARARLGREPIAPAPAPLPVAPVRGPDLEAAANKFAAARRPIAILGLDIVTEDSGAEVQACLERCGIPFLTTYKAKGVIDENHPLCLGAAGLSPLADRHLVPLLASADLVLCLGYDPIEMRDGWRNVWQAEVVIDIGHEPARHGMHQAGIQIVGTVGASLAAIATGPGRTDTWSEGEPASVASALDLAFSPAAAWGPAAIVEECRRALPPETIATADSGAHRILLSQMWRCTAPRTLLQSSALCTMGSAIPLAIGTSLVRPDVPVVAFVGDAGFLMTAGEIATAAELGLRPIIVVFVDASLALIEKKQRERQHPNAGVDFGRHDFAAIGRAFGGRGHRVTDREGLRAAIAEALTADVFTVIAAEIERQGYDGLI